VGKFTTSPDSLGKQWSIDSDGKLSGIMVVSISKEELSSFIPNSSTVYNIITDSSFGNEEIASLLSKINNNVGEGTVLNLADATATSINTKIYGKMTSVVLPVTCTILTSQIFESAYYLEEIRVSEDNTAFSTQNGILYDKNKTKLISYPAAKPGDTFDLPSSVTKLGYAAFRNNKYLETINGLSRIQELADMVIFADTQKLKEIDLSGLTQPGLPYYTFTRSQALEKVTLSSSITNIGLQCFQDTSTLTEVHFKSTTSPTFAKPSKTEDLEYYKNFKNCPNVKFYVPSSAVDTYKNATLEKGFTNTDYNGAASTTEGIRNKIFGE
jgi:hypothetical protein